MDRNDTPRIAHIALILAMVLWGSSFIALKIAFQTYHPMAVIFGRMAVGSLCFLLFFKPFKGVRYQRGDWKPLVMMAVFEPGLYFIFEALAVVNTTASQAGMVTAMLPLLVAVAAALLLDEKITRRTLAGFGLAIAGVFCLSAGASASENAPHPVLGNILEFAAMMCATGYIITLKKLSRRYSPVFLTAVQAFVGAVFFLPIMLIVPSGIPSGFGLTGLVAVLYLGAVVTIGAYGCYNFGVSKIPASKATAYVNLIPVFAVLLGRLILGDTFTSLQYAACALVFAGVYLSQDLRLTNSRKAAA